MGDLIGLIAYAGAALCLIVLGVALFDWIQQWIVTYGLLRVTIVSGVGVIALGFIGLITFDS